MQVITIPNTLLILILIKMNFSNEVQKHEEAIGLRRQNSNR